MENQTGFPRYFPQTQAIQPTYSPTPTYRNLFTAANVTLRHSPTWRKRQA